MGDAQWKQESSRAQRVLATSRRRFVLAKLRLNSCHNGMHQYVEDVIDLIDPSLNRIHNMTVDQARSRILSGTPDEVRAIDGSFALLGRDGKTVRLARSMDRPMRYFLAKRHEGPALVVADRIDQIYDWLRSKKFDNQFHPS